MTNDADTVNSDDDRSSSSSSKDLRGFSKEEKEALDAGSWNDRATYLDFTTCDVPKFMGDLNPVSSIRWIITIEGAFCTSECEDKSKEFKEMFYAKYAPVEEIDKIREEFHSLTQTNETVNELWNKFNDMVPYCPKYHGNENLKVDKFQRMIKEENRKVISPFKCTTLEDLLERTQIREADLTKKKNNKKKELKR
nr:hypothetical protein [Tanacetum cinerariifolium]